MFIAVFPSTPTPALTAALIDAGYRPVPVGNVAELTRRVPRKVGRRPSWNLATMRHTERSWPARFREEHQIPVLVVADRLHTDDLEGRAWLR